MIKAEGRGLKSPTVALMPMGRHLVIRVDDMEQPDFWLTLTLTPAEVGDLFELLGNHLAQAREWASLTELHGVAK